MALVALAIVACGSALDDAAAAKQRLGRYYGGTTAQEAPFVLQLARGSKDVDSATFMVRADCDNGRTIGYYGKLRFTGELPDSLGRGENLVGPRRVSRSGKLAATGIGSASFGELDGAISYAVSGRLRRSGAAAGTFRSSVTLIDGATPVAVCSTGRLSWSGRSARGRVYAGTTSANLPFVLEANADRSAFDHVRFGWVADCEPDGQGGWMFPEDFADVPLSGPGFGEIFRQPFELEGGGRRTFDYDIQGRLAGMTSASGTTSVKVTETDPAGAVTSTCDSGTVGWTARSG